MTEKQARKLAEKENAKQRRAYEKKHAAIYAAVMNGNVRSLDKKLWGGSLDLPEFALVAKKDEATGQWGIQAGSEFVCKEILTVSPESAIGLSPMFALNVPPAESKKGAAA